MDQSTSVSCKLFRPGKTLIILKRRLGCAWFLGVLLCAQTETPAAKSDRARRAVDEGRFAEAAGLYADLVKTDPSSTGLVMNLGLALDGAGRSREAVEQFRKVLSLEPGFTPALVSLGIAWRKAGEPAKAVGPLEKALGAEPRNRMVQLELADAYSAIRRFEEAAELYLKFTRVDATQARAWKGLGLSYVALGRAKAEELRKLPAGSKLWKDLVAGSDIYREPGERPLTRPAPEPAPQKPEPDCAKPTLECEFLAGRYWQLIAAAKPLRTPEALYWQARAYEDLAFLAFSQLSDLLPPEEIRALLGETDLTPPK